MDLQEQFAGLRKHIDGVERALAEAYGLPRPGATLGISFDSDIQLSRIPTRTVVVGWYAIGQEETLIEVIKVDEKQGIVYFEMNGRTEFMSAWTFLALARPRMPPEVKVG